MERRKALAVAATVTAAVTAAATAMAANLELLGSAAPKSPVGRLDAQSVSALVDPAPGPTSISTSTTQPVQIIYEDIPVPGAPAAAAPAASGDEERGDAQLSPTPTTVDPGTAAQPSSPAPAYDDKGDDSYEYNRSSTTEDQGSTEVEQSSSEGGSDDD